MRILPQLAVLFLGLVLSGCSTVDTRIQKNPTAYENLSVSDRALVRSGGIREGMTRDTVFIAWGRPDSMRKSARRNTEVETWIYTQLNTLPISASPAFFPSRWSGPFNYFPTTGPSFVTVEQYYRSVVFEGGRVVAWDIPLR